MPIGVLHCLLFSLVWDLYSYFLAFWLNTDGQIWLNYILFPHITPLVSKRCILAYHYLRISDVSKTVLFQVITSLSLLGALEGWHYQIYRPISNRLHAMHSIQRDAQGRISKNQLWAIT